MNAQTLTFTNLKMPELQKGDFGDAVRFLQQLLILRYGHRRIPFDAHFNVETEAAVKEFQGWNGLVPDGIVGNKTWRVLGRHLGC